LVSLRSIILALRADSKSLVQLLRRTGTGLIGFFKKNPSFVAPTVAAFATFVIAIYAVFTYGVQRELKQLQANMVAMQTEPKLSGSIGRYVSGDELKKPYHYRLTNIGSDTAWSVFAKGRAVILCDTMIIYPETYLFGLIKAPGALRGEFSRWNPIGPAETEKWGFDEVIKDFIKLSNILGGIILLEVDFTYWSDSPITRYGEQEYFVYNKRQFFQNDYFEKLERTQDRVLHKLSSLKDTRKIACLRFGPGSGPAFLIDLFGDHMFILSNPVPFPSLNDFGWTYRDTFIVADSTIEYFLDYRRQFPEYQRYERLRYPK
jgi:hypothetical protein